MSKNQNPNISKISETEVWNEVAESFLTFSQKMKLLARLKRDNYPKFAIQQNLERWMIFGESTIID